MQTLAFLRGVTLEYCKFSWIQAILFSASNLFLSFVSVNEHASVTMYGEIKKKERISTPFLTTQSPFTS